MSHYVEFPVDLLMKVHWKKKPDDGGGDPTADKKPGPCGMYTSWTRFGEAFSLQPDGLWVLKRGSQTSSTGTVIGLTWLHIPHLDIVQDLPSALMDYLWSDPTSFSVTVTVPIDPVNPDFPDHDVPGIRYWRNANPQTWNPCEDPPSGGAGLFDANVSPRLGTASTEILAQQKNEQFPPIVIPLLTQFPPCSYCAVELKVQAHCPEETDGGLPPQPAGFPAPDKVKWIGPPLPGSLFYGSIFFP